MNVSSFNGAVKYFGCAGTTDAVRTMPLLRQAPVIVIIGAYVMYCIFFSCVSVFLVKCQEVFHILINISNTFSYSSLFELSIFVVRITAHPEMIVRIKFVANGVKKQLPFFFCNKTL